MADDGHLFDEFVGGFEYRFVSVEEVSEAVVAPPQVLHFWVQPLNVKRAVKG